jgi:alpha-N-acetylglucosamine transferase
MAQPEQSSYLPRFLRSSPYLPIATANGDIDASNTLQVKPNLGQILRSRRVRYLGTTLFIIIISAYFFYRPATRFDFHYPHTSHRPNTVSLPECTENNIDWSRFAYVQYVTNTEYLCNSVMLFEILHRLGSKADRLMMYPASMHLDATSNNKESQLILRAQKDYGVKLIPIEVQHRELGDRKYQYSWTPMRGLWTNRSRLSYLGR